MPNISFDIFYNTDLVNLTVSRSGGAPKAKPDWKVRQAPKLAPKPKPTPENTFGRQKPSQQKKLPANTAEVEEVQSEDEDQATETKEKAKKEPVKQQKPAKSPQPNGKTSENVNGGEKKKLPKLNKQTKE